MERKEAIKIILENWPDASFTQLREALETLIPELKESKDERIRKAIILGIKRCEDAGSIFGIVINNEGVNYQDVLAWLEKQKEQKPAEWSEEDENALEYLHELICFGVTEKFFDGQTAADMRIWVNTRLKSVRPRPQWKPSEEQMKGLRRGILRLTEGSDARMYLESLYNDLKKLI